MIATSHKAKEIFVDLIRLPAEQRAARLESACDRDESLRLRVRSLLEAHQGQDSFLLRPADPGVATVDTLPPERIGTQIGPYKLLEQIGEGGMGLVYVAEQTRPVRRKVALKLIKPGMDTQQVIARFEAERQALAMMDHPNIARVLDAGTVGERKDEDGRMKDEDGTAGSSFIPHPSSFASAGRPYFVMELVRGLSITDYCEQARLPPRQCLELFIDVCHAVQHAHQKGIIHRDLKPSNVMVTLHDGKPVVKVIDFGVAKAIGAQLTDRTIYTAHMQLVGTPLYMSPEQAELSGLDIDTRSDVYSLGVLLYELLTGTTPFDKERLKSVGFDEMRRIIREEEPETVSARIARTRKSEVREQESGDRGKKPELHPSSFRLHPYQEIDWIVMKALEKDRSRRYESASALAADILRYLSDEPVLACPPTAMYRFQKFARKHKPALFTAAGIALCLLLGTTVSAWQAVRATTAEAQANANAAATEEKAKEANTQRDEAQKQRDEVKALADKLAAKEQQLQRTLYAAHINLAHNAWDAGGIERVRELLDQHLRRPGETDLRGFEWYYLDRLCHAELLTLKGHSASIPGDRSVAFSPDGKRLAIASEDNTVKVWDAQSGQELLTFKGNSHNVASVAFSPDGKRLASASGILDDAKKTYAAGEVKIWDAQTGRELLSLKGHASVVFCVAFSPDGKQLASSSRDNTVKVWDAETGVDLLTLKNTYGSVVFSPDGKRLATGNGRNGQPGEVKVWDTQTGEELLSLKGHTSVVNGVAFSPDGKRLASASSDKTLKIWDTQTGQELLTFTGQIGGVGSVAFSPDGKRLASGGFGPVKVLDALTGAEVLTLKGHNRIVTSVVFSPDGTRLASGSADGTAKIWIATAGQEAHTFSGNTGRVRKMIFSPDGKRLAGAAWDPTTNDGTVKVWDAQTEQELLSLKGAALSVVFSPDGKRLASGSGTWDDTKKAYVAEGEVKVWNAQTGQELLSLKGHTAAVVSVVFSPDGTRLASSSSRPNGISPTGDPGEPGEVKVWDALTGDELLSLKGHSRFVNCVTFSPDGKRLATLSRDNTVKVWDVQTGQEILTLKVVASMAGSVAFSPDGKRLASTSKSSLARPGPQGASEVKVWDAQTGDELLTLKGHAGVISVVFSPDGKRLASGSGNVFGSGGVVKLWDAQTGQELLTLKSGGYHEGLAFSPDGHLLASDLHGTPTIWDATPLPEKP